MAWALCGHINNNDSSPASLLMSPVQRGKEKGESQKQLHTRYRVKERGRGFIEGFGLFITQPSLISLDPCIGSMRRAKQELLTLLNGREK